MTIFYRLGNNLYVNITNRCPCSCIFCIRNLTDSVGDAPSLWLEQEPTLDEIKLAFQNRQDLNEVNEVVFCGYGEPMARANDIFFLSSFIKKITGLKVRINTNGLVNFLVPDFDISKLTVVDSISVSLNADDAEEYVRLVRPQFGLESYNGMLDFAKNAKKYTDVTLTVMSDLGAERIDNCYKIAKELGVPLRVRGYM